MRSSMQRPAAAADHSPAVLLTAMRGDTGESRKLTADRAGPKFVPCYLPRGLLLGTDAVGEVSR